MTYTIVRMQTLALLALSVLLSAAGVSVVMVAMVAATSLVWWQLSHTHRRAGQQRDVAADRPSLDAGMRRVLLVALAGAAATALAVWAAGRPQSHEPVAYVGATLLCLGVAGVVWSSLVDFYWVLPWMSGLRGQLPCQHRAGDDRRISWEDVTRYWYLHRLMSAAVVIAAAGGLIGDAGATVALLAGTPAPAALGAGALTAVVGGVLVSATDFYREQLKLMGKEVLRPTVQVGEVFLDHDGRRHYVVDVAAEGVQVMDLARHAEVVRQRLEQGNSRFGPKNHRSIELKDINGAVGHHTDEAACAHGVCRGVNWYCPHNPRAYQKP